MIKVLFIGNVETSVAALKCVLRDNRLQLCGILTSKQNDFNSDYASLADISEVLEKEIPVIYKENVGEGFLLQFVKDYAVDVVLVVGWSFLVDAEVAHEVPLGVIGYHPSELPKNRGRHPIIWAVALGLERTASTFFYIEKKVDAGPIIDQQLIEIAADDTSTRLYKKIINVIPVQLSRVFDKVLSPNYAGETQDNTIANNWRKRSFPDGVIDWRMPTAGIVNLVRALQPPYPFSCFKFKENFVNISLALEYEKPNIENVEPGRIFLVSENGFVVKTGDGFAKISYLGKNLDLRIGVCL